MLTLDTANSKPPVKATLWCLTQQHMGCVWNGIQRLEKRVPKNIPRPQMGAQETAENSLQENSPRVHEQSAEIQAHWMSCSHRQPSSGVPKITCPPGTRTDPPQSSLPAFLVCISQPVYTQLTTTINPLLFITVLSAPSPATAQVH